MKYISAFRFLCTAEFLTLLHRIEVSMLTIEIETHGCKLNTADSQQIAAEFLRHGFAVRNRDHDTSPDIFILNSCTVTHVADKKARQSIAAARRRYPNALTVLTGCYPERDGDGTSALHSVDIALGNAQKSELVQAVAERLRIDVTPCASGREPVSAEMLLGRTRASVKIQEGCDQVCAYCIVPKVRGRERSITPERIVEKINQLEDIGCREVVFTGTQLGHYGFDLDAGIDLTYLLKSVLKETSMPRIRVSSLQPPEISHELLDVWVDDGARRICPHFHMPLQSGSDAILSRMRRTYSSPEFLDQVELVRQRVPDCGITTDIIVGFPGETDDDHEKSVFVMETAGFSDAHVFPYSPRPGTSAVHFDQQVDHSAKVERAQELRGIVDGSARAFRTSILNSVRPVLWEGRRGRSGMTDNYVRVQMESDDQLDGGDGLIEDVVLREVRRDGLVIAEPAG